MLNLLMSAAIAVVTLNASEEPTLRGNVAAARAIAKAENEFAALSMREGTAKAFRDSMDPIDGVTYGGGSKPAVGRDAIYAAMGGDAPDDTTLSWYPTDVYASKQGDLGVARGRWTATPKSGHDRPVAGSYVTVWRKDANGQWKGFVDIGNADKAAP
jgi:ketosteroid isomerase-like protein